MCHPRRSKTTFVAAALTLTLGACGPELPASSGGEDESSEESGGGESEDADTGDGDGDPGDGDGDGDGDPGDGDGDGEPLACPERAMVEAQFRVTPPEPMQGSCTLAGESVDNNSEYEMIFDCEGADVSVTINSTISPRPNPWGLMSLDYRVDGEDRWLAIHSLEADVLILGAVAAGRLDPPGSTLPELFREPQLRVGDEQPCEVAAEPCGEAQRLALTVELAQFGEVGQAFDGESWLVDFLAFGYAIEVERALAYLDPEGCGAPGRFELLTTWFPSD